MAINPSPSNLDQTQILQRVMDGTEDRLRVDALVTASIGDVITKSSESSISIGNPSNSNTLNVISDGSIDVNVILNAGSDTIASYTKDGTGTAITSSASNSKTGLDVNVLTDTPYALQLDNTSTANVTYVGIAPVGSATSAAVWRVKKLDQTTGLSITWAGSAAFNQIWDNRTSLTYV